MQKKVLVTGTSRRVGLHIAKRLHEEGYAVLAHYRSETHGVQALRALGIEMIQGDFASREQILDFVARLRDTHHTLRAIIHNASSFTATDNVLSQAAKQYEQFFHVHMMAPFLINQGTA